MPGVEVVPVSATRLYNPRMLHLRAGALVGLALLFGSGCRCNGDESDAGVDGGIMLASTNSIVPVTSTVTGILQLHITATLEDIGGANPCQYLGNVYEGYVPMITTTTELDLSCPNDPNDCPTFFINWTGTPTSASLGGFSVSGIGNVNCQVALVVEGLGAGMAVLATGMTNNAFAQYNVNRQGTVLHLCASPTDPPCMM